MTSSIHPGQPCCPSVLCCEKANPKLQKVGSLLENLKLFEPSLRMEPDSCICRSCRNEIKDVNNQFIIGEEKLLKV